jgi:hypothetical protein
MRFFGPDPVASKSLQTYRVRIIRKNSRAKPTYLFLTFRTVGSQRLQGILLLSFFDTAFKETSYAQAYAGGLFREQGMDIVKQWLEPLFRPLVDTAYSAERRQYLVPWAAPVVLTVQPVRQRGPSPQAVNSARLDT